MSPARTLPALFPFACVLVAVLTSCTAPRASAPVARPVEPDASRTTAAVPAPAPATATRALRTGAAPVPPAPPTRPALDPVAAAVVERLATQLMVPPEGVVVDSMTAAEWPDGCLGLPAEGEICTMVVTPGYAITARVGIDSYEFRTDLTGERIRLAVAPAARTGDPLVTWQDSQSFTTMIVGTQRVAIGRRGRPLIASPLAVPARATELQGFLAHFGPFQAQTPAGEIALRGVGVARATAVEQRMIAEWARLVSLEARAGAEQPEAVVAVRWIQRRGDTCDLVEITRTGVALARTCREGGEVPIATLALGAVDMEALYGWLDRFEAFEWSTPAANPADSGTTDLIFRGTGFEEAVPADHQALVAWVESVILRLRREALAP